MPGMNARAAKVADWPISNPWVRQSSRRLSIRSATSPAHADRTSIGPNWHAGSSPTAVPLSVRCSTSRVRATIVSQFPLFDTSWPTKNSRKLRMRREEKVSPTSRPPRPATPVTVARRSQRPRRCYSSLWMTQPMAARTASTTTTWAANTTAPKRKPTRCHSITTATTANTPATAARPMVATSDRSRPYGLTSLSHAVRSMPHLVIAVLPSPGRRHARLRPVERNVSPGRPVVVGRIEDFASSVRLISAAGRDQARLVGEDHRLDAVAQAELGQEVGDVGLDRRLADVEALGDLGVRQAPGQLAQHLQLTAGELLGQLVEGRPPGARTGVAGELVEQAPGHPRLDEGVTPSHRPHPRHQVVGGHVLQQEAAGAGPNRVEQVLVEIEGGEDEDPGVGHPGQAPGGLDPVHPGHAHVHQHDVGGQPPGQFDRLVAIGGLTDDLEVVLTLEDEAEARPDQGLVVHHQDADQAPSIPRGKRAWTRHPGPGWRGPAWSMPPTAVGPDAGSVVVDEEHDEPGRVHHLHLDVGRRPGMTHGVGQRLLYDPVDGEDDAAGARRGGARLAQADVEAGLAGAATRDLRSARPGRGRRPWTRSSSVWRCNPAAPIDASAPLSMASI